MMANFFRIYLLVLICMNFIQPSHLGYMPMLQKDREMIARLANTTQEFCLSSSDWGLCVYLAPDKMTQDEAQEKCIDWGGHLMEVSSSLLRDVAAVLVQTWVDGMWLGANRDPDWPSMDMSHEMQFKDVCPRPLSGKAPPPPPPSSSKGPEGSKPEPIGGDGDAGPQGGHPGPANMDPNPPLPRDGDMANSSQSYDGHQLEGRDGRREGSGGPRDRAGPQWGASCTLLSVEPSGRLDLHLCDCFAHYESICIYESTNAFNLCPPGFSRCRGSTDTLCFKEEDPPANWFVANERCQRLRAELPDASPQRYMSSYEAVSKWVACSRKRTPVPLWTGYSSLIWRWFSTDDVIELTEWAPRQPKRPIHDCLVINQNGQWSVERCSAKRPFVCINNNDSCSSAHCVSVRLSDNLEAKDEHKEQSNLPQNLIIGMVALLILIVCIIIILIVICCKIRKVKGTSTVAPPSESLYYCNLARRDTVYENDGPEFDMYSDLQTVSVPATESLTPENTASDDTGSENPGFRFAGNKLNREVSSTISSDGSVTREDGYVLQPRKGSLPPTPDVVPLGSKRSALPDDYLELLPGPYGKLSTVPEGKRITSGNQSSSHNESLSSSSEDLYADRDLSSQGQEEQQYVVDKDQQGTTQGQEEIERSSKSEDIQSCHSRELNMAEVSQISSEQLGLTNELLNDSFEELGSINHQGEQNRPATSQQRDEQCRKPGFVSDDGSRGKRNRHPITSGDCISNSQSGQSCTHL